MNSTIEYAYRRYCSKRFPKPTERQLATLEVRLRAKLPDDFREFLLDFNGGYFDEPLVTPYEHDMPPVNVRRLYGVATSDEYAELASDSDLALFDDNDPLRTLPIGDTHFGGLFCISFWPEDFGRIMYKHPFGEFYHLADGIEEFFGLLVDDPSLDELPS